MHGNIIRGWNYAWLHYKGLELCMVTLLGDGTMHDYLIRGWNYAWLHYKGVEIFMVTL